VSRHPAPADPMSTLSIPKELWYPTPVHTNVLPAPKPRLPTLVRLLPVVALVIGYTSALASTAHVDAAAAAAAAARLRLARGSRLGRRALRRRLGAPPSIGHRTMTGVTRLPIWLRLSGPVAAELGGSGTVAASTHRTALAAVLVSRAAVVLSASPARLLRGRS
jgi:hypothetical protein